MLVYAKLLRVPELDIYPERVLEPSYRQSGTFSADHRSRLRCLMEEVMELANRDRDAAASHGPESHDE